jgi:hypothetical protein
MVILTDQKPAPAFLGLPDHVVTGESGQDHNLVPSGLKGPGHIIIKVGRRAYLRGEKRTDQEDLHEFVAAGIRAEALNLLQNAILRIGGGVWGEGDNPKDSQIK